MKKKRVLILCSLALLIGIGGCRRQAESGGRNFSFNFDSEKEEDLAVATEMYNSLCDELKSRDFKEVKMLGRFDDRKSTQYVGVYEGFPLTVEIHYLLSVSEDEPEFYYRVSFEEAAEVDRLDKASKDLRVLMEKWCTDKK